MPYQINSNYLDIKSFIEELPVRFPKEGKSIYKIRNEVKIFEVDGYLLNVKSYKVPNLFNKIAYCYIRGSKAKRAYKYADFLLRNEIETPAPVAWVECHNGGMLKESYYVSIQHKHDFNLRDVLENKVDNKTEILNGFVDYTVNKLHKNGVFHLDYSPGNILIRKEKNAYSYSVIDLNRMKFFPISIEKGMENLKQLNTTAENYKIIGRRYGELFGINPETCAEKLVEMDRKYQEYRSRRSRLKRIFKKKQQ